MEDVSLGRGKDEREKMGGKCGLRETAKLDVTGHERTGGLGDEDRKGKLRLAGEGL